MRLIRSTVARIAQVHCHRNSRLIGSPRSPHVKRSCPTRKTVLGAPPPEHRRVAPFASEAADHAARLPYLRRVVNRLAIQATEKDAQWSLVCHLFVRKGWFQVFADRQARFAAMSTFKSAAIARTCSVIRMTGKSLASLAISSKSSVSSRRVSNRSLYSSILVCCSRVRLLAGEADRDI